MPGGTRDRKENVATASVIGNKKTTCMMAIGASSRGTSTFLLANCLGESDRGHGAGDQRQASGSLDRGSDVHRHGGGEHTIILGDLRRSNTHLPSSGAFAKACSTCCASCVGRDLCSFNAWEHVLALVPARKIV